MLGVWKTKNQFEFSFKRNEPFKKFDIHSDGFLTETECSPQKVTKNNFTCIQCADKECFKTRPKLSLVHRFLLTTVSIYGMHSSFNIAVTL